MEIFTNDDETISEGDYDEEIHANREALSVKKRPLVINSQALIVDHSSVRNNPAKSQN